MTEPAEKISRKPRADAARNRQRLLDAAKQAFADKGPAASLEEIARVAGVGIGTLYRHFPTRDALVEQVYRSETTQLADAATRLGAEHPPVEALRAWLRLFVEYLAAKRIIGAALQTTAGGTTELYAASGAAMTQAIGGLIGRAVASGAIHVDIEPLELLRAIAGVANVSDENAMRLIDILIAGMLVR
ncbi:TetR/AcrR family transcriptional regulator [Sphingomonas immobilis]|uniref:TetR family transcriptional regulator n=1 Tax=Sphingomonas immobilis TaxID=3063997 RepID=A0ABT9A723_9SPHN|nr:TetR family transcriptional regulator [Sphingomonas sp. CA1-15]MDO7844567.1 TetR family transcriptional regulator [Sphingomonas sp. CA1-15]